MGAVVDRRGKLHGLEGLHVIDAPITPAIPAVPTNLTTITIAERCADAWERRFLRRHQHRPAAHLAVA
jgi:5-(hydroxymethyl)furfural/furfural oxidase